MLVPEKQVTPVTHRQALNALLSWYRQVLGRELAWMQQIRFDFGPSHLFFSLQRLAMQASQLEGRGQSTFRPASVHSFSTRLHSPWPTDLPEGAPA